MSKLTKAPFFCQKCQKFTFLPLGFAQHPICSFCKTPFEHHSSQENQADERRLTAPHASLEKSSSLKEKNTSSSSKRRSKKARLSYLRIASLWLVLVLSFSIIGFFIYQAQTDEQERLSRQPEPEETYTRAASLLPFNSEQMKSLTEKLLREYCAKSLISEKTPLTHNPSENTIKMRQYYRTNPFEVLITTPRLLKLSFVSLETGNAIQSTWENPLSGKTWEVSLRCNTFEEWLLDWEEFVRYNPLSLHDFLEKSSGPLEENFRILLEKTSTEETDDTESPFYIVKVFPPSPNGEQTRPLLQKSPPLLFIEKDSPIGLTLKNYWEKLAREDVTERGIALSDPANTLRLSVRLKKIAPTEKEPSKLEITEIYHEGWASL